MKKILIDANVLRRLIEYEFGEVGDEKVIKILNSIRPYMKTNLIYIDDQSFFEVIDNIDRKKCDKKYSTLIELFNEYNIDIVCRESTKELFDKIDLLLAGKMSIKEVKKISFNSFIYSLLEYIFQVSQFLSLSILKILSKGDYSLEWYVDRSRYVISSEYYQEFMNRYKELIRESYFNNKEKTKVIIDEMLKETIVGDIAFYKLYESKEAITPENFSKYFRYIMELCKEDNYLDLLDFPSKEIDYADIIKGPKIDFLSYEFLKYVCLNLIIHKKKIKLNDIVDFTNFKIAYENGFNYLTLDKKSLNKYEEIFSGAEEVIAYIKKCKNILS